MSELIVVFLYVIGGYGLLVVKIDRYTWETCLWQGLKGPKGQKGL